MANEGSRAGSLPEPIARRDPVVRVGGDAGVREYNGLAADLFVVEDPTGEPLWAALGVDADGALADALASGADDGGATVEVEADDGRWYRVDCYPDGDGHLVRFEDVTERKRERARVEKHEQVLRHLPDPVYVTDVDARFEFVNRAFADLYEVTAPELIEEGTVGMGLRSEDVPRCQEAVRELLSGDPEIGDWKRLQVVGITSTGERVPLENRQAIYMADGEFRGSFGTLHEVGERRRNEQRLKVLERVLRHNLRTQLVLIDGHADDIGTRTDDPSVSQSVAAIREASDRLIAISDKTRRVGEAIVSSEERDATDLRPVVRRVVDRVAADHPDATFAVDVDPDVAVRAGDALELAVEELVENAVVHDDADAPTVEITETAAEVDAHEIYEPRRQPVVLRIADDGPGIPETERRVVEEGDVSPLTHSDGLGLWTAAWIVQAYGGDLTIADRDGGGSVVEITLPAAG